jgi:hypothetical protein
MMIEQRQGSCDTNFQNALLVTYHSLAKPQSWGEGLVTHHFGLPREITAKPIFDVAFSPRCFEILLPLRCVALIPTTFPIHNLKRSAFLCRIDTTIIMRLKPCR